MPTVAECAERRQFASGSRPQGSTVSRFRVQSDALCGLERTFKSSTTRRSDVMHAEALCHCHHRSIDTSVWVDHFRRRNDSLVDLLTLDLALTHPMVVTELACGTPPAPRTRTLLDIALPPQTRQANLKGVRDLIERERLYGQGCGLVDLTLLASTLLTPGTRLWTRDNRLVRLAERFDIAYRTARH